MGGILYYIIIGGVVFFIILDKVVRSAVEEGTLKALLKYEKLKSKQNRREDNES